MIWTSRYNEVKGIAETLMGKEMDESRREDNILMKMTISYVLAQEGMSEHSIADAMGKDHSTINYYKKKVKVMMETPQYHKTQVRYIMSVMDKSNND